MKKFMTILLPLAAAAATVAAQGLGGFKNQLAAPDGSYGSRIQITEHGTAASAVSSMQTNQSGVKIRGYRVRIFSDNSQNARSAGQNALSRFRELYPGIPADMTYDTPYFKVTVGNCLTAEEATILWGKIKDAFDRAFVAREEIPLSSFKESQSLLPDQFRRECRRKRVIFGAFDPGAASVIRKISTKPNFLPGKFIFRQKFHWITVPITNHFYTFAPE